MYYFVLALLLAQWLDYPTARVPRTRDGKPNLTAPAPRTADGKPDLSGIWSLEAPPCAGACADYAAGPEFLDLGAKLSGGLPYQGWAADLVKKRSADLGRDDPVAFCKPSGAVRLLTFPPPRKILMLPGLVVILSERDVTYRQIFTDGRPPLKDPDPSFNGYSTGKWEGSTLVVQTNGFRDGIWLDRKGSPMTDAAKTRAAAASGRRMNSGTEKCRSRDQKSGGDDAIGPSLRCHCSGLSIGKITTFGASKTGARRKVVYGNPITDLRRSTSIT